jgi:hypothetical protein
VRRRQPTWRLTDRGWTALTVLCCLVAVVVTWTCIPLVAPWADVRL